MKKILIIDSFALIFRAFYAYPITLTDKNQNPINAVYGFTSMLFDVIDKFKPEYIVAVFDPQSPLIRQTEMVFYKANRKEVDSSLLEQIPVVENFLGSFGITVLKVDGYEADDVIGTLVKSVKLQGLDKIIVTGDQDLFQLVDDKTNVFLAGKKFSESKVFKANDIFEKLGVYPHQVVDYKSLKGDPSDNIPGVSGIGDKSAIDLINEFGSVDSIYKRIEEVKPTYKKKLVENYEMAMLSKKIATIIVDVPLTFELGNLSVKNIKYKESLKCLNDFKFISLIKKLDKFSKSLNIYDSSLSNIVKNNRLGDEEFSTWVDGLDLEGQEIYLRLILNSENASPVDLSIKRIYLKVVDTFYTVDNESLKTFISYIVENKKKIMTVGIKDLLHCAINTGLTFEYLCNLEFEDLGFATQILYGGQYGHKFDDVINSFKIDSLESYHDELIVLSDNSKHLIDSLALRDGQNKVYLLEKDVVFPVVLMERSGFLLNSDLLESYRVFLDNVLQELRGNIYNEVGMDFNINSPKQVGEVLFEKRGLSGVKKKKSGGYQTGENILKSYVDVDPVVKMILDYREVNKFLSTYIIPFPSFIRSDSKVYTTFDQLGAISGRFSSNNPNMQNIPTKIVSGINMRDMFESTNNESHLVSFDYSQQELRILAHLSQENKMIDAFNNGLDIHLVTASELFNKDLNDITKEERTKGKVLNFSIIYGVSAFGLSEDLKVSVSEAEALISSFYNRYDKIREFFDINKDFIRKNSFSETIMGRRRVSSKASSSNFFARSAVERELLNFIVQGSAADIMKMAMVFIMRRIENFPVNLLLQVHDEFLFEYKGDIKSGEFKGFVDFIVSSMKNCLKLSVGYDVDVSVGKRWGSLQEIYNIN